MVDARQPGHKQFSHPSLLQNDDLVRLSDTLHADTSENLVHVAVADEQ